VGIESFAIEFFARVEEVVKARIGLQVELDVESGQENGGLAINFQKVLIIKAHTAHCEV
jgi:hypothetical protein